MMSEAGLEMVGAFQVKGGAVGSALVLSQPLSFWGGIDVHTGNIIDGSHPNVGTSVAGRILVMPGARGSSSSSSVLAEAIRRGTAPAGILIGRPDPILAVGAIVADFLYCVRMPLVVCDIFGLNAGKYIRIEINNNEQAIITVTNIAKVSDRAAPKD